MKQSTNVHVGCHGAAHLAIDIVQFFAELVRVFPLGKDRSSDHSNEPLHRGMDTLGARG